MRYEVYWNLHKGAFSLRSLSGDSKGKVVARKNFFRMKDVKFAVQPAGRERVLRERSKNVHAFVRGSQPDVADDWDDSLLNSMTLSDEWVRVTYNPYKYESFVIAGTEKPIYSASEVRGFAIDVEGKTISKMYARC